MSTRAMSVRCGPAAVLLAGLLVPFDGAAVPVVASDAFVAGRAGDAPSAPTAAFGAGVYFVAWLELGAGDTALHVTLVTPGATLAQTRVTGEFTMPVGTTLPGTQLTSAFDGSHFVSVFPTGDANNATFLVVEVDPSGMAINPMSDVSGFVGSRIAIACGGGHCALAGATAHDMGGVIAFQPGNTAPTAFAQGLFDLPSIAWSGRDFRMSFDTIDTFAMDLSIVNATVDTADTPVQLGSDTSPIRATRIACDPSNAVCFVASDHDIPGADVHGAIANADGSSPTGRFNFPDVTPGVSRRSPDVGFHGPVFLLAWVDTDTAVTTRGIGANFYAAGPGFVDPPVLIVPAEEQGDHPAIASTGAGQSIVAYTRPAPAGVGNEIALRFIPPLACTANCVDAGDGGAVDASAPDSSGAVDVTDPTTLAIRYRGSGCSCSTAAPSRESFSFLASVAAAAAAVAQRRIRRRRALAANR